MLEQFDKPFLREMFVMGQDFGDALLPHRLHRNAVGQAVFLVRAGFVEVQAGKECLAGLRVNRDGRIGIEIADKINRFLPENSTGLAKSVEHLGQNLFGRDQMASQEGMAGFLSGLVPLVLAVGDRDPIERIDEDPPHVVGRFGVP